MSIRHLHGAVRARRVLPRRRDDRGLTYQRALGVAFGDTPAHRERTRVSMEQGWFRGYVLHLDGRPAAFHHGELYGGRFRLGSPGYDARVRQPEHRHLPAPAPDRRPLHSAMTRESLDYGIGDADYKRRFGTRSWHEGNVFVYAPTFRGIRINLTRTALLAGVRGATRILDRVGLARHTQAALAQELAPHDRLEPLLATRHDRGKLVERLGRWIHRLDAVEQRLLEDRLGLAAANRPDEARAGARGCRARARAAPRRRSSVAAPPTTTSARKRPQLAGARRRAARRDRDRSDARRGAGPAPPAAASGAAGPSCATTIARFTGTRTKRKRAARDERHPEHLIVDGRVASELADEHHDAVLTAASTQSMTARKRGRFAAKRTGPVKNAIAFPIPTRHRNCSAIPACSHSVPSTATISSLAASTTSSTGTAISSVVRKHFATASRSFSGSSWRRERTGQRDEPHRAHRHFQQHVDEPVGEPVEADRDRSPEDAHQQRVGAAVDEAGEVGGEDVDREADQLARVRAREAEAGPPGVQHPHHHEQRRLEHELLRHERPDARAGQRERNAGRAAEQHREVRAEREPLEVELPLHQRVLDDAEALDDDQDREHVDHVLERPACCSRRPTSRRSGS